MKRCHERTTICCTRHMPRSLVADCSYSKINSAQSALKLTSKQKNFHLQRISLPTFKPLSAIIEPNADTSIRKIQRRQILKFVRTPETTYVYSLLENNKHTARPCTELYGNFDRRIVHVHQCKRSSPKELTLADSRSQRL